MPFHLGEKQKRRYLENTIRLDSIQAQTGPLPPLDNLVPVPNRARAPPQRCIRPEHGAEGRGWLETLRGVDMLEHFARHRKAVFYGLPVRCIKHPPPPTTCKKKNTSSQLGVRGQGKMRVGRRTTKKP